MDAVVRAAAQEMLKDMQSGLSLETGCEYPPLWGAVHSEQIVP